MKALPDNVPRFGLVEACDHFLHVSRTYPREGRTLIQLAVDPMMLDELCVYDAVMADLEPDGDLEGEGSWWIGSDNCYP